MFAESRARNQWWAVFALVGAALGVLLEIAAANVPFWSYNPWWLVFFVVLLAFGASPATLARWLRRKSLVVLFLVGSALAFLVEGLSAIVPTYGWMFAPGFPLGIHNAFWRTVALGLGGGLFVLLAYAITYQIFFLVTRPDKDQDDYEKYKPESVPIADIPDPFERIKKELDADPAKKQAADAFYEQLKPKGKKMLLSIDGGGSKGYITLQCLAKLEELTGRKCSEIFDFFAGTSTGSLIAAGMAMEISAHKLCLVYRCKVPVVFQSRVPLFGTLADLLRPNEPGKAMLRSLLDRVKLLPRNGLRFMYRHDKLWKLVREVLSDDEGKLIKMGDIDRHLLITIKDVARSETLFAVNCGPGKKAYQDFPLAYAVMGSSVAPIFLQPLLSWIDGGVGTYQNPCYRATFVATQVVTGQTNYGGPDVRGQDAGDYDTGYRPGDTVHFSFGTGVRRNTKDDQDAARTKAHEWLLYVVGEGQEDGSDDQVRMTQEQFARGAGLDFRRFQIVLDPEILAAPVEEGGLGMAQLQATGEEAGRLRELIETLEMDAHNVEELEVMEMLGQAWAEALATDPDGQGIGFTRPHYPYVDWIAHPTHPDADRVYFPPATPPQLLPSYVIDRLPGTWESGLRGYRSKQLARLTDKVKDGVVAPGYLTRRIESLEKELGRLES
jgi:hypothetical protein